MLLRPPLRSAADESPLLHCGLTNARFHNQAGDPMKAVASRGDLASPPQAFGGYDTKVMLLRDAEAGGSLAVRAVSGPTHAQLAPFTWDNAAFANVSHLGQPTTFDFGWELFTPMPQPSGAHE